MKIEISRVSWRPRNSKPADCEVRCVQYRRNVAPHVEFPPDILAFFALAEQNLNLERKVMKQKEFIVKVKRKLRIVSSPALLAQHSALGKGGGSA